MKMPKFDVISMFKGIDEEWVKLFTDSSDKYKKSTRSILANALKRLRDANMTPPPNDVFNFARATKYNDIKVIIIGQDPYPKEGDAHGLSFSSKSDKIPASLKNIYKCLVKNNVLDEMPKTADLTYWAQQGVLLLNTSLTTEVGTSNAHAKVWNAFTDRLLEHIVHDERFESLIFMLWGEHAKRKREIIGEDHIVFEWCHPSPLAQRGPESSRFDAFAGFNNANDLLANVIGVRPIDWNPIPSCTVYTDGACSGNGKKIFSRSGYAACFGKGLMEGMIFYGKVAPSSINGSIVYGTNQRAEGLAIITALEKIQEFAIVPTTLVTDSNFWKDMIEDYMPAWDLKGVDFDEKKNSDITKRLYNLTKEFGDALTIVHVKSHNKDPNADPVHVKGNAIADEYAVKGKDLNSFKLEETYATHHFQE